MHMHITAMILDVAVYKEKKGTRKGDRKQRDAMIAFIYIRIHMYEKHIFESISYLLNFPENLNILVTDLATEHARASLIRLSIMVFTYSAAVCIHIYSIYRYMHVFTVPIIFISECSF